MLDSETGSPDLMIAMRIVMMTASEIRSTKGLKRVLQGKKLSDANEKRTIQGLAALMAYTLARYPTTYDVCRAVANQAPLPSLRSALPTV
jgi:hypothetical protein